MIGSVQPDTAYQGVYRRDQKNDLKSQQVIQQLRMIEQKVKAHEMAHKAAGGELAGPIHYKYKKGPDGKLYIVGGEVPIKIKEGKTPEETIEIAQKIKRAALAPADPSPQDRAVAARASILEMKARVELLKQQTEGKQTGQNINLHV
ncbi:SprA-related family protein [Persephonella hydrogeniphila]|uniref:SprA-related family protein n=1 Tax=Persephonella hydrogeniphila TaxID=198703 RepID=A0A285NL28_9AQUI|nr:putative metalloprotease CJM1_0395 family protein [Persephonella hydrogeniphila]SNZ08576.1 SprA-related family protein [Persephonella hydrogeniphila]